MQYATDPDEKNFHQSSRQLIESRTHGVLLRFRSQNSAFNTLEGLNEVSNYQYCEHLILTSRGYSRSDLAGVLTINLGFYDALMLDKWLDKG